MHRKLAGIAHPGSPKFIRKSQQNVLELLAKRAQPLEQLGKLLFGGRIAAPQTRKLVATLATLLARRLVAQSDTGTFRITADGRTALLSAPPEDSGPPTAPTSSKAAPTSSKRRGAVSRRP